MLFSKIFQILFIVGQPLRFWFFRCASIILGGVSRCHSHHLKTEEEFLFNLALFSSRFMILAWCHPLIIVFDCENSFHPSGAFHELFPFLSSEGHHVIIPNLTGTLLKYPLISSCSLLSHVSKSLQVSSFVFQFFPVNCALATFIFNSHGGSFKISFPSLSY